ncbi:MAG: ketosteroid isomerase-like protein [Ilumatobacteraceae bacterium]|nr:ketosteroid isomerase-like protein [Ilumatobacteraceae bacterium]
MSLTEDLNAAWNSHDPEKVASFYADTGAREEFIITHARVVGREAIATQVRMYLDAMPDLALSIRKVSWGQNVATFEWMVNATHSGDAEGWPAKGEAVAFPGVSVLDLSEDGLIIEERVYTDFTGLLAGAGLIPGVDPPSW